VPFFDIAVLMCNKALQQIHSGRMIVCVVVLPSFLNVLERKVLVVQHVGEITQGRVKI